MRCERAFCRYCERAFCSLGNASTYLVYRAGSFEVSTFQTSFGTPDCIYKSIITLNSVVICMP